MSRFLRTIRHTRRKRGELVIIDRRANASERAYVSSLQATR